MSDIDRVPSMAKPIRTGAEEPESPTSPETEVPTPPAPEPDAPDAPPAPPAPPAPLTRREVLAKVDSGWATFRNAAAAFPSERMDERLTDDGWTRKQMLAHVATWHDLTHDRLGKLIVTGKPAQLLESVDAINARAARVAIGKTAGEVLKDMEATFNRLRRQVQRLTDAQFDVGDGWATQVIAANTYDHYADHIDDVYVPEPVEGSAGRR